MNKSKHKGRPAQISKTDIVECALKTGLHQVSMHSIGKQLGVSATALYRHVGSKDELITECCDFVMGQVEIPYELKWEDYLYHFAQNFRKVLLTIPGSVEFIRYNQQFTPASSILVDNMLGVFRLQGFEAQTAFMAFATVFTRVTDIVQHQEHAEQFANNPKQPIQDFINEAKLPHLVWLLKQTEPVNYDRYFDDGINISIEGLKAVYNQRNR